MSKVTKQQKHQVNMHQDQYELATYPTDATRLKDMQVKMVARIRKMPTGWVSDRKSTTTMVAVVELVRSDTSQTKLISIPQQGKDLKVPKQILLKKSMYPKATADSV